MYQNKGRFCVNKCMNINFEDNIFARAEFVS